MRCIDVWSPHRYCNFATHAQLVHYCYYYIVFMIIINNSILLVIIVYRVLFKILFLSYDRRVLCC